MTSPSERAYVWTWLPEATNPVVAGVLAQRNGRIQFAYGQSYLARTDAISLYEPELPLRAGWSEPASPLMRMPSCIRDASPDSWGRRVIHARLSGRSGPDIDVDEFTEFTYALTSGSNRIGALDFQQSATDYVPRNDTASLDAMHRAADELMAGQELDPLLVAALTHGTSIGGARPKVLLEDGGRHLIAKLSKQADIFTVVKAEAAAMDLARRVGINAPASWVMESLGRDVLIVERFDRPAKSGRRRMMVSALTMLGLDETEGRYATYPDLLDVLRTFSAQPGLVGRALFERIVFNVAISNNDDHARNHAAFWDGQRVSLTPAYDLCPQPRSGGTSTQAMAIDRDGNRDSSFAACLAACHIYGLSQPQAREVIDHQVDMIKAAWTDSADAARLTNAERTFLWGRQILNPAAFYGYAERGSARS